MLGVPEEGYPFLKETCVYVNNGPSGLLDQNQTQAAEKRGRPLLGHNSGHKLESTSLCSFHL